MSFAEIYQQSRNQRMDKQERLNQARQNLAQLMDERQQREQERQREQDITAIKAGLPYLQDAKTVWEMEEKGTLPAFLEQMTGLTSRQGIPFAFRHPGEDYVRSLPEQARKAIPNGTPAQWLQWIRDDLGKDRWEKNKSLLFDPAEIDQAEAAQSQAQESWQTAMNGQNAVLVNRAMDTGTKGAVRGGLGVMLGGQAAAAIEKAGLTPEIEPPKMDVPTNPTPLPTTPRPKIKSREELEASRLFPEWQPTKEQTVLQTAMAGMAKDPVGTIAGALNLYEMGYEPAGKSLAAIAAAYEVPREPGEDDPTYFGRVAQKALRVNEASRTANINAETKLRTENRKLLLSKIAGGAPPAQIADGLASLGIYDDSHPLYSAYMTLTPKEAQMALNQFGTIQNAATNQFNAGVNAEYKQGMLGIAGRNADTNRFNAETARIRAKSDQAYKNIQAALGKGKWDMNSVLYVSKQAAALMERKTQLTTVLGLGGFPDADGKVSQPFDEATLDQMNAELSQIDGMLNSINARSQQAMIDVDAGTNPPVFPAAGGQGGGLPRIPAVIPGAGDPILGPYIVPPPPGGGMGAPKSVPKSSKRVSAVDTGKRKPKDFNWGKEIESALRGGASDADTVRVMMEWGWTENGAKKKIASVRRWNRGI